LLYERLAIYAKDENNSHQREEQDIDDQQCWAMFYWVQVVGRWPHGKDAGGQKRSHWRLGQFEGMEEGALHVWQGRKLFLNLTSEEERSLLRGPRIVRSRTLESGMPSQTLMFGKF
jgi:hypothetical protein